MRLAALAREVEGLVELRGAAGGLVEGLAAQAVVAAGVCLGQGRALRLQDIRDLLRAVGEECGAGHGVVPFAVARRGVGPELEQGRDATGRLAAHVLDRHVQGSLLVLARQAGVGTAGHEQADGSLLGALRGEVQRRLAVGRAGVGVRPLLQEGLDGGRRAVAGGVVERRPAEGRRPGVHVGARGDERAHLGRVVVLGGGAERCQLALRRGLHIRCRRHRGAPRAAGGGLGRKNLT
mmetsp:Transcript_52028/g.146600  ORF Transcript_52028/g.146600 Transcript_52028/m.146600 type:complete len:236 (+) Transcript_52028:782-1489(+)